MTQWLIPSSYHRGGGGSCVTCRRKPFYSDIQQTAVWVIWEEMSEQHVGIDQDPVPTCKAFVKSVVGLFLALYHVY